MREIKFRAMYLHCDEWVYGGIVIISDAETGYVIVNRDGVAYNVKLNTIGQFTGLLDYHEKFIYEGDILECKDGTKYAIEYCVPKASFIAINIDSYTSRPLFETWVSHCKARVIGNIQENPETIKDYNRYEDAKIQR